MIKVAAIHPSSFFLGTGLIQYAIYALCNGVTYGISILSAYASVFKEWVSECIAEGQ
jgi:hypothetical protein